MGSASPLRATRPYIEGSTIESHQLIYTPPDGMRKDTLTTRYNQSTGFFRDLALALNYRGQTIIYFNYHIILFIWHFRGHKIYCKSLKSKIIERKIFKTDGEIPQYFEI